MPADAPGGVWIVHVNAPEAVLALAALAPSAWLGRYRIGYWAYELTRIPASWVKAADFFHEIWAPSRFVADAISASGVSKPICVMPHPVALEPAARPDRPAFSIPVEAFTVLALGDLLSSAERKNLRGAIGIYKASFPSASATRRLLIKTQSGTSDRRFESAVAGATSDRPDIVWMDAQLRPDEVKTLIASCDVLLSPHRSEGFGLPLAEAFLAGVPALATGWSGNLEFMAGLDDLLIGHALVPVRDAQGIYRRAGLSWAEPDMTDACAKLRALEASGADRNRLAAKGKAAVEALNGAWSSESLRETELGRLAATK